MRSPGERIMDREKSNQTNPPKSTHRDYYEDFGGSMIGTETELSLKVLLD